MAEINEQNQVNNSQSPANNANNANVVNDTNVVNDIGAKAKQAAENAVKQPGFWSIALGLVVGSPEQRRKIIDSFVKGASTTAAADAGKMATSIINNVTSSASTEQQAIKPEAPVNTSQVLGSTGDVFKIISEYFEKLSKEDLNDSIIEPIRFMVEGLKEIDFESIKDINLNPLKDSIKVLCDILKANLASLAEDEKVMNFLWYSFPDMLKALNDGIAKLNVSDKSVESIKHISDIVASMEEVSKSVETLNVTDSIVKIKELITGIIDIDFGEVKNDKSVENISKRLKGIGDILKLLSDQNLDQAKVKQYTSAMKDLTNTIDQIAKIKIESNDQNIFNNAKTVNLVKHLLSSVGDLIEWLSRQNFEVNNKVLANYSAAAKNIINITNSVKGLNKAINIFEAIQLQLSQLLIKGVTMRFRKFALDIQEKSQSLGKIDISNLLSSIKSIELFVKELKGLPIMLIDRKLINLKFDILGGIIDDFISFVYGGEVGATKTEEGWKKDFDGTGLIDKIKGVNGELNIENINNNIDTLNELLESIDSIKTGVKEYVSFELKRFIINNIIGGFIKFMYGGETGAAKSEEGWKKDFDGTGLIDKIKGVNGELNIENINNNIDTLNELLESIDSIKTGVKEYVSFELKRFIINNIIGGFIKFMYGGKKDGLIKKLNGIEQELKTTSIINSITSLNALMTALESIKLEIGLWMRMSLSFWIIESIIGKYLQFMYGVESKDVTTGETKFVGGLIKTLNDHKEVLDIGIIQTNTNQVISLLESLRSIASIKNLGLFLISPIMSMVRASVDAIISFIDWVTVRARGIADVSENLRIITNTIREIRNVVVQMDLLMLILVASVPLFIIFLIASPAVLLGLVEISLMILALRGLVYLIEVLRFPPNAPALFAAIDIMLGLMVLTIVELLLFALFSDKLWKNFANICKGIIALAGIAAALVVTSALISLGAPFFALGAIGAVAMFAVVGAFLFVAGALYLLQFIQLDEDKIMENVHKITRITRSIINELSMNPGKPAEEQTDRGFLEILGGAASNALTSICSFVTVAAAGLAVAAMLIMSGMLFLIQLIPLNEGKILENVRKIIDTVLGINEMLNSPAKKAEEDEESKEMWYDVILYALKPVATFVNTLFSMATLVIATITVAAILLIASMLRILQTLNLDPNRIMLNVKLVLKCVNDINSSINTPMAPLAAFNGKDIMGSLISYISSPIGSLWNCIVTLGNVAMALISVGAVVLIAKMLNTLSDIDPSAIEKAQENARLVMTAAKNVQAIITSAQADKEEKSKKPWWAKALGVLGMGDLAEAIVNISSLATMMITIGCLAKLAEQLNSLKLNRGSANAVVQDARTIVNAATLIYNYLNTANFSNMKEDKMEGWTNNLKSQEKLLKQIKSVGKMEEGFLESLSIDRLTQGSNIATETLRLTNEILKNFDAISVDPDSIQEKLGLIDMMNDSIRGIATVSDSDVKNTERLTDSYIRFINRLDQADLQRLNIAERMMRSWAYIAQAIDNDFDKLVLMMSDKMMPMLDTMNKTMEGVSKVQGDIIKQLTDPTLAAITPNGGDFGQSGAGQTGGSSGGSSGGGGESEQGTAGELLNGGTQTTGDSKLDVNTPWSLNNNTPSIAGSGGINNTSVRNGNNTGVKGLSGKGTRQDPVYAIIVGNEM